MRGPALDLGYRGGPIDLGHGLANVDDLLGGVDVADSQADRLRPAKSEDAGHEDEGSVAQTDRVGTAHELIRRERGPRSRAEPFVVRTQRAGVRGMRPGQLRGGPSGVLAEREVGAHGRRRELRLHRGDGRLLRGPA